MISPEEPSPIISSYSTTEKNAKQVFSALKYAIQHNDSLKQKEVCGKIGKKLIIECKLTSGKFESYSSNPASAEGENSTVVILDEAHAIKSPSLFRAIQFATSSRTSGLSVYISTAGIHRDSFWYGMVQEARNIIAGKDKESYRILPVLFEPQQGDKLDSPATWRKANPSMDLAFSEEEFADEYHNCMKNRADQLSFYRQKINVWTSDEAAWLDADLVEKAFKTIPIEELKKAELTLGMDLANGGADTNAVVKVFKFEGNKYHLIAHNWATRDAAKKRTLTNMPAYEEYGKTDLHEAWITITDAHDGLGLDREDIINYITAQKQYRYDWIVSDKYHAQDVLEAASDAGFNTTTHGNNYADFTWSMKSFEMALREGRLTFEPNDFFKYQLMNVVAIISEDKLCRPSRTLSRDKIDGAVAALYGYGKASSETTAIINFR